MSLLNLGKSNNYSLVTDYVQNPMVETMGEAAISTEAESAYERMMLARRLFASIMHSKAQVGLSA